MLNKLTYKNIFCALCNGISTSLNHKKPAEQPWYKYHIDFGYIDSVTRYIDETVDVIEWLPVELRCDRDKIEYYVQNKPTHSALMDLVYGYEIKSYLMSENMLKMIVVFSPCFAVAIFWNISPP